MEIVLASLCGLQRQSLISFNIMCQCSVQKYVCLHGNVFVVFHFQALRMMMGLDLVSIHHRILTLNNLPVPNGEPLFQNGTDNFF